GLWAFSSGDGWYPYSDGRVLEGFGTTSQYDLGNPAQALDQFHVFDVSSAANDWNAWINGLNLLNLTNNTFSYYGAPSLGRNYTGSLYSTYSFAGDIAEVLVYNRVLNSSERAALAQYLKGRYA